MIELIRARSLGAGLIRGRGRKAGLSPGSLVHVGEKKLERTLLTVFDYDPTSIQELTNATVENCLPLRQHLTSTWINVDGLHETNIIETLGQGFGIHPLILEDLLNTEQRPKLEDCGDYLFVVLKMLVWDDVEQEVLAEQVSLILGRGFVITFQETVGDVFDMVRDRLRKGRGRARKLGSDYLMYALIDAVIDNYFIILERLGDRIELLEEELMHDPDSGTLQTIHHLKRQMIYLRKSVWPLREVIGGLERGEVALIHKDTRVYLRDVYDHTIQVIDTVETYRDVLAGMLDVYISTISNKMNAIMKVLTIIATIFIPLTFIASVYGMNLKYMPWLDRPWAFGALAGLMASIAIGMLAIFKLRRWF